MIRFLTVSFLILGTVVHAQTQPSDAQIAAYDGLHRAAHENDVHSIQELVAAGADLNIRDESRRTPAHVAAFASNQAALQALAAVADDPEMVLLALELGNRPDLITSPYEGTALIAAAHLGHHEVVRRLIEGGAPLDHVNTLAGPR